jgi:hypothetical protein
MSTGKNDKIFSPAAATDYSTPTSAVRRPQIITPLNFHRGITHKKVRLTWIM